MTSRRLPERLMPLAAARGVAPYYGDIHNHCNISYGHGSLATALERARLQLDFVSITGHADWPDMPTDTPSIAHIVDFHVKGFAKLRDGWDAHFAMLQRYDSPGAFCVFPGYEIHSCQDGDYTIVYRDLAPAPLILLPRPSQLGRVLHDKFGTGAFAFPHHIGYRHGARGIDWRTFDPDLSPFVEIFSMHGGSETSLTERTYLHSMGPVDGPSTMEAGLAAHHRFGVVANTDHHSGFPGSYGHGRMCVYAAGLGREDLWHAMRERRANALTGDNIHLLTVIGDAVQGGSVAPHDDAVLHVEAVGGGFINYIDVIRNGALFHRISPELSASPITAATQAGHIETLLYLEMGWGARGASHLWEGTVSLTGGKILGVEPRFRGAEIVSPLEGRESDVPLPQFSWGPDGVAFRVMAQANPNNVTPTTQGVMAHIRINSDAHIHLHLGDMSFDVPASRLLTGAFSRNLGPIDSPAFTLHKLPQPHLWQWTGRIPLGRLNAGENVYVRLRQSRGDQMAWASPIWVDKQ